MVTLCVAVAILKDGRILLVKREDFEIWSLLGGHVESGESVAQAAIREVREETGLRIELTRLVGIYYRLEGWNRGGSHSVLFTASPIKGKPTPQKGEVLEICYFDPHKLPADLFWGHKQRINDVLNDVGGSVAWSQNMTWPFETGVTRQDIYELRDQSGLSKQAFFLKHFKPQDDVLEVGGGQKSSSSGRKSSSRW